MEGDLLGTGSGCLGSVCLFFHKRQAKATTALVVIVETMTTTIVVVLDCTFPTIVFQRNDDPINGTRMDSWMWRPIPSFYPSQVAEALCGEGETT